MAGSASSPAGTNVGDRSRADTEVGLLAAAVAVLSLLVFVVVPDRYVAVIDIGWWPAVVIAVMFAVFDYSLFTVPVRREVISFSLSEIPLVLCVVFVAPALVVPVRLAVAVPVLVFARANRGAKLAFNCVVYGFEVLLASHLYRGVLQLWGAGDVTVVVGAAAVSVLTAIVVSVLVSVAISRDDGDLRSRVATEIEGTWWLYPITAGLGAMTLALAIVEPLLAALAVLPVTSVWYVLHRHGHEQRQLDDLHFLKRFTDRIGSTLDVDEICRHAADELHSGTSGTGVAVVVFSDTGPTVHTRGRVPVAPPRCADDPVWAGLVPINGAVLVGAGDIERLAGDIGVSGGVTSMLVSGLARDGEVFGAVLVFGSGSRLAGGSDDVGRVSAMSTQLSVTLHLALLHDRLQYEARHDPLTGLPDRVLFERAVSDAVLDGDGTCAVLMLDLDRFKEVNDTLGHHAGDELLTEFSQRIGALLGSGEMLARLSGDEFAVLCRRPDPVQVSDLARTVATVGGEPVVIDADEVTVTVSVGVAHAESSDESPATIMRRADIAMYDAKWKRAGVEHYRADMDRRTPARLSMLGDLRSAIEDRRIEVMYQPQLDLRSGAIIGMEALVRWEDHSRGVVPASDLVRIAEESGLIKDLTELVLVDGITAAGHVRDRGFDLGVAVNVSTHDLTDPALPDRIGRHLADSAVDPARLTLEITESSLLFDVPRTRSVLEDLHEMGLRLAVDDFGTGYSSLSYLRRLPVDELKIDRSFVTGMTEDEADAVIVRSTIDLGHNLGLVVIAEGVETVDVLDELARFGCDVVQGFAISAPLSGDELVGWLQSGVGVSPSDGGSSFLPVT